MNKAGMLPSDLANWREVAEKTVEFLQDDPIVYDHAVRSVADHARGVPREVFSVRDVLGEQRTLAFGLLVTALEEDHPGFAASGILLLGALPYFWEKQISDVVLEMDVPDHRLDREVMPFRAMWFTSRNGWAVPADGAFNCDGFLLCDDGSSLQVHYVGSTTNEGGEEIPSVHFTRIDWGSHYPEDFTEGEDQLAVRQFSSMLSFINSPYVVKEERSLERPYRRRLEKQGRPQHTVRFVTLRRPGSGVGNGVGGTRHYHHQWPVSGHHRRQRVGPGRSKVRLIFIPPYIKGPEGAPMIERVHRVAR